VGPRVITKGDGQPVHRLRDLFKAHARMDHEKLNIGLVSRVVTNQPAGNKVRRRKREQGQAAALPKHDRSLRGRSGQTQPGGSYPFEVVAGEIRGRIDGQAGLPGCRRQYPLVDRAVGTGNINVHTEPIFFPHEHQSGTAIDAEPCRLAQRGIQPVQMFSQGRGIHARSIVIDAQRTEKLKAPPRLQRGPPPSAGLVITHIFRGVGSDRLIAMARLPSQPTRQGWQPVAGGRSGTRGERPPVTVRKEYSTPAGWQTWLKHAAAQRQASANPPGWWT